jgi:hypothetical protein
VRTATLTLAAFAAGDVDVCGVDDGTYLYSLGFGILLGECVDSRPPRCGWVEVIAKIASLDFHDFSHLASGRVQPDPSAASWTAGPSRSGISSPSIS